MKKTVAVFAAVLLALSMFIFACQQKETETKEGQAEKTPGYGQEAPVEKEKETAPGYGLTVPGYGGKSSGYGEGQQAPGYGK